MGQCKVLGNLLTKKVNENSFDQDKVLILLPDEKLLLPVLNSIPDSIKNINSPFKERYQLLDHAKNF